MPRFESLIRAADVSTAALAALESRWETEVGMIRCRSRDGVEDAPVRVRGVDAPDCNAARKAIADTAGIDPLLVTVLGR